LTAEQTTHTLSSLFEPGDRFELAAILNGKIATARFRGAQIGEAIDWAKQHEGKENLYLVLNPLRGEITGKRAKQVDVSVVRRLLIDCDPEGEDLAPAKATAEKVRAYLQEQGTSPGLVFSGRGWQVWLQHEPVPLTDHLRGLRKRFLRGLQSMALEGAKIDSTSDASRLARLPGTRNLKTGEKAVMVHAPGDPISLDAMRQCADALLPVKQPSPQPRRPTGQCGEPDWDRLQAETALDALSPDQGHDDWLAVGMALHASGHWWGFELWDGWSSHGTGETKDGQPSYPGTDKLRERWETFEGSGVNFGSLFGLAEQRGWTWERALEDLKRAGRLPRPEKRTSHTRQEKPPGRLTLTTLSEIEEREVEWLWEPYLPLGEMVIVAGAGKAGKSTLLAAICSAVTRGDPLELESGKGYHARREPGAVVLLSAEDDAAKVLKKRFRALGGDQLRVYLPKLEDADGLPQALTLDQLATINTLLERTKAHLLVIDPLQSFLGANVDMHRVNEVRPILDGLATIASAHNCCLVVICHFTKDGNTDPVNRIIGSADLVNRARSVMIIGRDHPGEDRAIVHERCNYSREGPSIGFTLGDNAENGVFQWLGRVDVTSEDLYGKQGAEKKEIAQEARKFLREATRGGPVPSKATMKDGGEAGISSRALKDARRALGIEAKKIGNVWQLVPPEDASWVMDGDVQ